MGVTKEETGLKRSAFLYNSCTTKHSGNISSIAKKNVFLCVYMWPMLLWDRNPTSAVWTLRYFQVCMDSGDKELADQGGWEGISLCPPWSLEDKLQHRP